MKAKRKPLDQKSPADFNVQIKNRLEIVETNEPPEREAGIKVASVDELVEKLKNDVESIDNALTEEYSVAGELAERFEYFKRTDFSVNDKTSYDTVLAKMQDQNLITPDERKLMEKYSNQISPKEKVAKTPEAIQEEKDAAIEQIDKVDNITNIDELNYLSLNLNLDQGASFSSAVTVKNADGTGFNLTGYSAAAKMALGYNSTRTRTTMTTTIAGDPTTGVVTLSLTPTQTAALDAPARYVFDVEITQTSSGDVTRVIEGI